MIEERSRANGGLPSPAARGRDVLELAEASRGADAEGYRREFFDLVRKAQQLPPR